MKFFQKHFALLLMAPLACLFVMQFAGFFMLARAEDVPMDLGTAVMMLFTAIKDKAVTAVIVMHVFQILRTNQALGVLGKLGLSGKGMRIAVALLTTLGYVADAWARSGNIGQAAIEGLFTSGGAMLLFDAFKATTEAVAEKHAVGALAAVSKKRANNMA